MSPNERHRTAAALLLMAAIVAVLLIAAPAASRGRVASGGARSAPGAPSPADVRTVTIDAAAAMGPDRPMAEAALMRRTARDLRHSAWVARRSHRGSPAHAGGTGGAAGRGLSVRGMVAAIFGRIAPGQVGTALCVANRESHFNPYARNPYSSAAGVFQWVSSSWSSYSRRYGFGGASVFDAYANISVAAHAVADGGWGPWGGGCW
jgi:hypothetical protein